MTEIALEKPAVPEPAPLFSEVEAKWYAVYRDLIEKTAADNPGARFGFIHLDGDDVPELVFSYFAKEDTVPSEEMVEWIEIYTIRNGEPVCETLCADGPFEYVARSGMYRFVHRYAAFGPTHFIYDGMDATLKNQYNLPIDGNYGYTSMEEDGSGETVTVIGFTPFNELGGWMEREISRSEYQDLMKVYFPVTAEASAENETAGAAYRVGYDVLFPADELRIVK